MIKMKNITHILILIGLIASIGIAQDTTVTYGVGVSFGVVYPRTDLVRNSKESPFARVFFRYYPSPNFGFETGVGVGSLEANIQTNSQASEAEGIEDTLFVSNIYPIDLRLVFQPIKKGKFIPYIFGGAGIVVFNPKNRDDQELTHNARGDYKKISSYFPVGAGGQFSITDRTSVGVSGTYFLASTKYLDDIKTGSRDAFWNITLNLFAYLTPDNPDLDGDGLLNDEEKQIGTDPLNPDTDGDKLRDGAEVHTYKTNPLNKDTDGDGLTDGEEVLTYLTNPLKKDTDGDGLTDGDEVLKYSTDPLKMDTDGDGLTDGDEVLKYTTDPLKIDTDGDGLGDGDEVLKYHTNPIKVDTDSDGLNDGDEVLQHKTDPIKPDTDDGGMPDGKEIQLGLNPLDPADDVPIIKIGERIILEGVNFETAKTALLPTAKDILDQVASSLISSPTAQVAIHGHTDNVGGAKYNMTLSIGRAEAVKAYLVSKGISPERITSKGFGFTKPIADNTSAEGKAKNRRIEFIRLK